MSAVPTISQSQSDAAASRNNRNSRNRARNNFRRRNHTATAAGRIANGVPSTAAFSTSAVASASAAAAAEEMEIDSYSEPSQGSMGQESALPYSSLEGRLAPSLLEALSDMGYTHMSPVQEKVLDGKLLKNLGDDAIVQAKTGTGKTTAFLLPTLQTLIDQRDSLPKGKVGVLILSPTRDLAIQIGKECDKLTSRTVPKIECHLAYGGSNKMSNLKRFMSGNPSVLVATPGRLGDYLTEEDVRNKFSHLRAVVLDEADTMLDAGFLQDLMSILQNLPSKEEGKWQGLLYSATMPEQMRKVTHNVVRPGCVTISTVSADYTPTVDRIPQSLSVLESIDDLYPAVHALLQSEHAIEEENKFKAIVFTHTARNAGLLYDVFSQKGMLPPSLLAYQMQSRMSQPARDRTVRAFKEARSGVMFASDVVGRGMDFPDVSLVVQIGLPQTSDQYVHRVGRTGRAGKDGRATMILLADEKTWADRHQQYPMDPRDINDLNVKLDECRPAVEEAMRNVPETLKNQAYVAFLGYLKSNTKYIIRDSATMVVLANKFSASLGLSMPPELERKTVGKMGLKGVPGLRIQGSAWAGNGAEEQRGGFRGGQRPSGGNGGRDGSWGGRGGGNDGNGGSWGGRGGGSGGRGRGKGMPGAQTVYRV